MSGMAKWPEEHKHPCGHLRRNNTYVYPSTGRRCCLTCKRAQARRHAAKRRGNT